MCDSFSEKTAEGNNQGDAYVLSIEREQDMRKLELLAPAKDLACGMAAIDHGADAVYIGAQRFGARAAAGNSTADIARLCDYAHQFGARVYVTVNTIIYDDELADTQRLLEELAEAQADAILVQDMGLVSIYNSQFSIHNSQFSIHNSQFSIHNSQSSIHNSQFTKGIWAVQFHPEVFHTLQGSLLLKNFVVDICGSRQEWSAASFVETTVAELKEQLGNDRVILGLSGGVDSSVAAVLLNKAIGSRLTCIFVDHGMLRKNEFKQVMEDYKVLGLNVIGIDASTKFFTDLAGVSDPEQKRKIIGRDFIEVFNAEAKKIVNSNSSNSKCRWLAQGTIYPDRIESLNITGKVIKSHHNVGGLPKEMRLQLCEPLKWLFKDEVRRVGRQLGMPEHLITRHPFPGPGLAVRILCDITPEKVRILQDADDIFIKGLREYKVKLSGEEARRVLAAGVPADMQNGEIEVSLYDQIWQAGVILLSKVRSVGVMGDERTYEHPVALRAVTSTDAMTADWAHLPYDFMARVSNEIINKVRGVNRVCYDISSKPPATIEWE